jgi:hypothetical protein
VFCFCLAQEDYDYDYDDDVSDPRGPADCPFQDGTFCGWTDAFDRWKFVNESGNIMISVNTSERYADFVSRASSMITGCLTFRHSFTVNHTADLSVWIVDYVWKPTVWEMSTSSSARPGTLGMDIR